MKNEVEKKKEKNYTSSLVLSGEVLVEMYYDKANSKTGFLMSQNGEIKQVDEIEAHGLTYFPYDPNSNLLRSEVVLFPSEATEYGAEKELINEVRDFIHKYLGISSFFEEMATFYVLFTWIYDCFNELPYLRALGDYGCGKSRFLRVIGSLCYKPMFTAGATSVSPIFRIIDMFRGTLVLDEADMKFSDTKSEMVKILNSGFSKGTPVMRSEEKNGKGYDIKSFNVYCPKILATRERFYDKALESRFLIEEMDSTNLRDDIPINLPNEFSEEATLIRNKLLMWRFRNYGDRKIDPELIDRSLEPRLNQIILPLMTIITDDELRLKLKGFISEHNKQLIQDRGFTQEADVLEAIIKIRNTGCYQITMKHIADTVNVELGDREKPFTPKKIGMILREKLKLKPHKTKEGYVLEIGEYKEKIENLLRKYDLNEEKVSEEANDISINW